MPKLDTVIKRAWQELEPVILALARTQSKQTLAQWAADCAQRALPHFAAHAPDDDRPHRALAALAIWQRGESRVGPVRTAALAAHAAARATTDPTAIAAARATGQAAAVAHAAGHATAAAIYAAKAAGYAADPTVAAEAVRHERAWQLAHLQALAAQPSPRP